MHPSKPSRPKAVKSTSSAFDKAINDLRQPAKTYPNVSVRWLLGAAAVVFLGALACAWLTLCLLYWQGSWQLLYHPRPAITRTPASVGLPFETIKFASTETGTTQLTGWWLPAVDARTTVLYLHSADGNLSDTTDTLAALHKQGLAVFAFDYRGFGQSQPALPHLNEKQMRQDAEWGLTWLTLTRHINPKTIIIYGSNLGANLASSLAANHSELAGVVLDQPYQDALAPVFNDPRSKLVPAHSLVSDRYDLNAPATRLQIPSLWLQAQSATAPQAYKFVPTAKTAVWLKSPITSDPNFAETLRRWLDDLH